MILLSYVRGVGLPALYGGSVAFVFPSRVGGFGLVLLEAMAYGAPVIAVVHAGRRGLAAGVIGNTVDTMVARGADPAAMTAAIGPCIHSCCYQVDGETAAGFAGRFGDAVLPGDRLDLPAAAGDELVAAGLTAERVHVLDICTCCDGRFFSHRRDGDGTGRQGAIAWIV